MNTHHLTDDDLNRWLVGEELAQERLSHAASCLVCRRRRDDFLTLLVHAQYLDPDQESLDRARLRALTVWKGHRKEYHLRRWMAAAAAVAVLSLVPLLYRPTPPASTPFDTDAVLLAVDEILSQDPLAAVAPAEVIDEIAPAVSQAGERSES